MRQIERLVYAALILVVLVAPLPLGGNREWSWSLLAVAAALLVLTWLPTRLARTSPPTVSLHPLVPALFLIACGWAAAQAVSWSPGGWHHPLWLLAGEALAEDWSGRVTLSPADNWTALMRLLCYGLVFFLALQFGRENGRAQAMLGWLTIAGLFYAVFGLAVFWGDYQPDWLFGDRALPHDVRGTFVNRNHFASWQGLTIVSAVAWFHHHMVRDEVKPYALPQDREAQVEAFVLKAWKPLAAMLIMVAALILTHSRGGFVATLLGTLVLLLLLDRRARHRKTSSRVAVIAVLAFTGIAFYLTSEVLLDRIDRTDITSEERLEVYADVNRAIADNPVLGFGYGGFADAFRLYDRGESGVHYDRAHNTWLENVFELGLPAALALYLALAGLTVICLKGVQYRHSNWVFPAAGVGASVLVAVHAVVDFSLQVPAVAITYACIMGVACAQSRSSGQRRAIRRRE